MLGDEPVENLVTWVYEEGSYVPVAIIQNGERYTIISDYMGRPVEAYNSYGNVVWHADYDIYGDLRNIKGIRDFIPFRQLGQYEDDETRLYYNRFRYYDPRIGNYISQDPIRLMGNNPALYGYVNDTNTWVDVLGLNEIGWNNGWRTPDGKFASPQGGISGQGAVDQVRTQLSDKGWTHLGDELSVRNSNGQLRRYDLVFKKPDGTIVGVEVKSNTATKTKAQRLFDEGVSKATPTKGVGKFKGQEVLTIKNVMCK